jgi:putative transposase
MIRKAYKCKLTLNDEQHVLLLKGFGSTRFVWNKAVALQKDRFEQKKPFLNYEDLKDLLTFWKEEELFLKDAPSRALQESLKRLSRAYKETLTQEKDLPAFKKKSHGKDSMHFPRGFKVKGTEVFVPKVGWIPFLKPRNLREDEVKKLIIKKEKEDFYASFLIEKKS